MYIKQGLNLKESIMTEKANAITKVSLVVSQGSLTGIYPGLIMTNGALMEGMEASIFFTFFGLDAITKKKINKVKADPIGNPAMVMPNLVKILPGMSAMATWMMKKEMKRIDFPTIPEFLQMIADGGGQIYACKASVDMFKLKMDDFVPQVKGILSVGEFYELSAGAQIIFT
jgi:peroxiredoxin family protein